MRDEQAQVDHDEPPNRPIDWLFVILCAIITAGIIACVLVVANTGV